MWVFINFRKKLKKDEIIEKLNKPVQLLKDKGTSSKTKEYSNSSNSYQTNPMDSFERTYSVVEQSSENSTSNEGTSYVREYKASLNEIFERRETEASTN